jgi:hypothetical protein
VNDEPDRRSGFKEERSPTSTPAITMAAGFLVVAVTAAPTLLRGLSAVGLACLVAGWLIWVAGTAFWVRAGRRRRAAGGHGSALRDVAVLTPWTLMLVIATWTAVGTLRG